MISGFDTALGEITLVLFTTLAPSGVVAFICMGLPVLGRGASVALRQRLNVFLGLPLVVAMVGLVASATHLGNPANALYVFLGVGRSPLSTEVFCAVVFLALAGLYWLYNFVEHPKPQLQRAWLVLAMLAGAVFVAAVGCAYAADTIVSWHTVYVPLNLMLNALVGGPILAIAGLRAAGYIEELNQELVAAKKELFNLRFQNATNQLDNTSRIKEVRRNIARIQTVITEKAN